MRDPATRRQPAQSAGRAAIVARGLRSLRAARHLIAIGSLLAALAAPSAAAAAPKPFGHPCTARADGTRFCPTTDAGPGQTVDGVPSFDGVPLDVDVTLPPKADPRPYPTIVMLHGYGGSKTDFEASDPSG